MNWNTDLKIGISHIVGGIFAIILFIIFYSLHTNQSGSLRIIGVAGMALILTLSALVIVRIKRQAELSAQDPNSVKQKSSPLKALMITLAAIAIIIFCYIILYIILYISAGNAPGGIG